MALQHYDLPPRRVVVGEDDYRYLLGIEPPLLRDERERWLGHWGLNEVAKTSTDRNHAAIIDIPKTAVGSVAEIMEVADDIPGMNGGLEIDYDKVHQISDPNGSVFEQAYGYQL